MATCPEKPVSTRAQRQEATRRRLLTAAAQQVGSHGYVGASIHKITTLADIANGTFYNYFKSQQDLFDQLLPSLGEDLLQSIRAAIRTEKDSIRREELGFRAFFDYLAKNPDFYRVLNEASTFAPTAYHDHMQNMVNGYLRALQTGRSKGELKAYADRELEVIVYILLSARDYLSYRYCHSNNGVSKLPDWVTRAYMKFIVGGVTYGSQDGHGAAVMAQPLEPGPDLYAVLSSSAGGVDMGMRILDQHLDDYGCVERSAIVGLIDRGAAEVVTAELGGGIQVTSLSTNFIRASHARTLFAKSRRPIVAGGLAHGAVDVHEHSGEGALIARGLVIFSLDRPAIPGLRERPSELS